ncbi:aspartate/glutamate racemase family protein [Senimuribacter intestinalis]|uniref:aspartate/glutamate racemase family protein n=1 Tax=Senimuribacter intestinalis TaxID=2941507 RepID=UPI0020401165|nr:amino acid racemase [Senimuribacter intestinalis]
MKTIGMIGGLSWHSSLQMYEYINNYIAAALGEYNCAKMVLANVNLQDVFITRKDEQEQVLLEGARQIEAAGCDFYIICSNTMHKHAPFLQSHIKTPLLHIADATADAILAKGISCIGLMGTRITMEEDFYRGRLEAKGLEVVTPGEKDRAFIDKVLFEETGFGIVKEESSKEFYRIAEKLTASGAEGVILGCTEIGMLMQQEHTEIPLFDTTIIHGKTAAKMAIEA